MKENEEICIDSVRRWRIIAVPFERREIRGGMSLCARRQCFELNWLASRVHPENRGRSRVGWTEKAFCIFFGNFDLRIASPIAFARTPNA